MKPCLKHCSHYLSCCPCHVDIIGLKNHERTHKAPDKAGPGTTKAQSGLNAKNKTKSLVKTLKMTVDMVAYEAMTAEVGCRGAKGIEVRRRCAWSDARCDGRTYETVKLYGGVASCDEQANWTEWEFEGIEEAGAEGVDYVVADCDGRVVHGKVWEIGLGKVVARHWEDPNRIRPGRPQVSGYGGGNDDEDGLTSFDDYEYNSGNDREPKRHRGIDNTNNTNIINNNNNNNNHKNNNNNDNNNNNNNNNDKDNNNNRISMTMTEFTTHINTLQATFQTPMLDIMKTLMTRTDREAPRVPPTPTPSNPNSMALTFDQMKELFDLSRNPK